MSRIYSTKTKQGRELVARTNNNEGFYLTDIYGSVSYSKLQAWKHCLEKFRKTENCHNFRIISHNSFNFSVAWNGYYISEETGECLEAVFIETSSNSYIVIL